MAQSLVEVDEPFKREGMAVVQPQGEAAMVLLAIPCSMKPVLLSSVCRSAVRQNVYNAVCTSGEATIKLKMGNRHITGPLHAELGELALFPPKSNKLTALVYFEQAIVLLIHGKKYMLDTCLNHRSCYIFNNLNLCRSNVVDP